MNDDLISRSALKEALNANCEDLCPDKNTNWCEHCCPHNDFEDLIDNAPTVEITEEQAIDKLHDTGWLPRHDKEMTERSTDKWISLSERLPEGKIDPMTNDFELVLCSTVWEVVRPYKFGKPKGHAKAHFWSGGGIMDDYVIAWMPLPESYKEAEDDTLN